MQKANKISAFFFLGLFSLTVLHQAFPHLHHQHEDPHSHAAIAHTGEHHQHDDHSGENERSPFGLFRFLMDMHVHSSVSSDIVVLKRNTVEQRTLVDKGVAKGAIDVRRPFLIDDGQISGPPIYHPPNTYFNPYLSRPDLRGPPSLG